MWKISSERIRGENKNHLTSDFCPPSASLCPPYPGSSIQTLSFPSQPWEGQARQERAWPSRNTKHSLTGLCVHQEQLWTHCRSLPPARPILCFEHLSDGATPAWLHRATRRAGQNSEKGHLLATLPGSVAVRQKCQGRHVKAKSTPSVMATTTNAPKGILSLLLRVKQRENKRSGSSQAREGNAASWCVRLFSHHILSVYPSPSTVPQAWGTLSWGRQGCLLLRTHPPTGEVDKTKRVILTRCEKLSAGEEHRVLSGPEEWAANSSWECVCFRVRKSQATTTKKGFDANKWIQNPRRARAEGMEPAKAALALGPAGHADSASIACPSLNLLNRLLPPSLKKANPSENAHKINWQNTKSCRQDSSCIHFVSVCGSAHAHTVEGPEGTPLNMSSRYLWEAFSSLLIS